MQLVLSFPSLLATVLLVVSSLSDGVQAAPAKRASGIITLPLKRIHQVRGDVHPQVLLQQHINRSLKRYARITGGTAPSKRELEDSIEKRLFRLPKGHKGNGRRPPLKRYNRPSKASPGVKHFPASELAPLKFSKQDKVKASKAMNSTEPEAGSGFDPADLEAALKGGLTPAEDPNGNNSLGLDIEANDVGYVATVQVGTPPQDFTILMDSGSADFWVPGDGCQSVEGGDCGPHKSVGPESSSTLQNLGTQFQVTYGTGAVAGLVIQDDITLAGLALKGHKFGAALLETDDFANPSSSFDGLMGLAQSSLSEQKTLTPVEALAQAGLIPDAITSYKISRLADGKNDGEITFGGLDTTKFDPATLVTLDNAATGKAAGFWVGAMTVTAGGKDLGLQGRTAILDTGTTLIVAPQADADAVHARIPGAKPDGQGGFTFPCTTNASVALTFGGQSFEIDPRDMLFAPVDPRDLQGDCVSGITAGTIIDDTTWLVGDVFLKNAYFSTDVTKNQISLAKLV